LLSGISLCFPFGRLPLARVAGADKIVAAASLAASI
jgi:hypothetical protein